MKSHIFLLFIFITVMLHPAEKPPQKNEISVLEQLPGDVQRIIESKLIPQGEIEHMRALQQATMDFGKSTYKIPPKFIDATLKKYATNRIKEIRSFLTVSKRYYTSIPLTEYFINRIAQVYRIDPIIVAILLNTQTSRAWLNSYIKQDMQHMNRAIGLFLNAAKDADLPIFMALAQAGVPANASDRSGNTALSMATSIGNGGSAVQRQKIVDWLLENDADANKLRAETIPYSSPLFNASRSNDTTAILRLLEHEADPNFISLDGTTPLQWAVSWNNLAAVQAMIAHGLTKETINAYDSFDNSPLKIAKRKKFKEIEKLLKKHGAKE